MSEIIVNTGAVVLKESNILLVQENEEPYKNKWNFPLGKLEHEKITDGVVREVEEETGYRVKLTSFLGVYQNIPTNNINVVLIMFAAAPISGELKFDPNEHIQAKWFTVEEFERLQDSELFHTEMRNVVKRAIEGGRDLDNYKNF